METQGAQNTSQLVLMLVFDPHKEPALPLPQQKPKPGVGSGQTLFATHEGVKNTQVCVKHYKKTPK